MKAIYKNLIPILLIIISAAVISSCEKKDAEADDSNGFEVVSSNGAFDGYYKVDGGTAVVFSSSPIGSSIFHSYQKNLISPKSLRVYATGSDVATSISIYIYENEKEVSDVTVLQTVTNIGPTATLSYEFGSTTTE